MSCRPSPREIACSIPHRARKKPSTVLSPLEGLVLLVHIRRQKIRRARIDAGGQNRRRAADIGREPRRDELLDRFRSRHEDFAANLSAFFRA